MIDEELAAQETPNIGDKLKPKGVLTLPTLPPNNMMFPQPGVGYWGTSTSPIGAPPSFSSALDLHNRLRDKTQVVLLTSPKSGCRTALRSDVVPGPVPQEDAKTVEWAARNLSEVIIGLGALGFLLYVVWKTRKP